MESKRMAGEKAAELIKDGMTVGLGTGSTVYYTILKIGEMVKNGLNIKGISTSSSTSKIANELGIPLIPLNEVDYIDITIDGADEVDNSLNGIKGGGGALLHEKLVAVSSNKVIWVVDSNKRVNKLGKFPLPVEVIPFSYRHVFTKLENMNFNPKIRMKDNNIFVTDEQNYIIDLCLNEIENLYELQYKLNAIPGIVEHGLFLEIADTLIIGNNNSVEVITRNM
jgi:ribose 5-phosphate isomerase A